MKLSYRFVCRDEKTWKLNLRAINPGLQVYVSYVAYAIVFCCCCYSTHCLFFTQYTARMKSWTRTLALAMGWVDVYRISVWIWRRGGWLWKGLWQLFLLLSPREKNNVYNTSAPFYLVTPSSDYSLIRLRQSTSVQIAIDFACSFHACWMLLKLLHTWILQWIN